MDPSEQLQNMDSLQDYDYDCINGNFRAFNHALFSHILVQDQYSNHNKTKLVHWYKFQLGQPTFCLCGEKNPYLTTGLYCYLMAALKSLQGAPGLSLTCSYQSSWLVMTIMVK